MNPQINRRSANVSDEDFHQIDRRAITASGSCGGMYTANTMGDAFASMGMNLLNSSTMANAYEEIEAASRRAGSHIGDSAIAEFHFKMT